MQQPSKFLIIQLRQIGDVLISTSICETLKKNFPHAQVDYMVYPYAQAIVENNPAIDNIIVVPNGMGNNALRKMWHVLKFIRRQKYDYAIDIVNTPKSGWITALSGANLTIGRQSKKIRQRFYDIKVPDDKNFLAQRPVSYSVKNRLLLLQPIFVHLQENPHLNPPSCSSTREGRGGTHFFSSECLKEEKENPQSFSNGYVNKVRRTYRFLSSSETPEQIKSCNSWSYNEAASLETVKVNKVDEVQWVTNYQVYLTAAERDNAHKMMLAAGIDFSRPIFFFMPGCRSPNRDPARNQWPIDYFIAVMNECVEKYQAQIVTYPGPGQLAQLELLRQEVKYPQSFFIINNGSIRESAAIIAQSDMYIGNDTAPHHVAIGFDTPSVAVFAPRINFNDWQPVNNLRHLSLSAQEAMQLNDKDYLKNIARCDADVIYEQECYRKMTPDLLCPKIAALFAATYRKK